MSKVFELTPKLEDNRVRMHLITTSCENRYTACAVEYTIAAIDLKL